MLFLFCAYVAVNIKVLTLYRRSNFLGYVRQTDCRQPVFAGISHIIAFIRSWWHLSEFTGALRRSNAKCARRPCYITRRSASASWLNRWRDRVAMPHHSPASWTHRQRLKIRYLAWEQRRSHLPSAALHFALFGYLYSTSWSYLDWLQFCGWISVRFERGLGSQSIVHSRKVSKSEQGGKFKSTSVRRGGTCEKLRGDGNE